MNEKRENYILVTLLERKKERKKSNNENLK